MITASYKPSLEETFWISQPWHGLGESGLVEILPLVLYKDNDILASFDEYLLLPCKDEWDCWNPEETRCFFLAMRYPEGTFPEMKEDLPEDKAEMVIAVLDVTLLKVVFETPVGATPLSVCWNPTGERVVITRDEQKERNVIRSRAKREYDEALSYMRSIGPIQGKDPADDPTRLEHYLMNYDERYCGPDPFAYAVRQRNLYFKAQEMAIPYDEHILEKSEPEKVSPPPEQEPSAESEPSAEPEAAAPVTPAPEAFHSLTKEERAHNRGILLRAVLFVLLVLGILAFFTSKGKGSAAIPAVGIGVIGATVLGITMGWKRVFPREYNVSRLWVFLGLTISTIPYQIARGINYLVTRAMGESQHGWVFIVSSACILTAWFFCITRRNACTTLSEAKRWGWATPVLSSLLVGFFIYTVSNF